MQLKARRLDRTVTSIEVALLQRGWTHQDLATHAGISRMTLYFLLHPGEYGHAKQRRRGAVLPRTAQAIVRALVGPQGDATAALSQFFEVVHPVRRGAGVLDAPRLEQQTVSQTQGHAQ